jgi:hypothetical protein
LLLAGTAKGAPCVPSRFVFTRVVFVIRLFVCTKFNLVETVPALTSGDVRIPSEHLHPGTLHPGRRNPVSTHTPGGQHHLEHNEAAASGRRWWRWEETHSPSRRIDGFNVVVQRPGSCGHGGRRRWWCGGREKSRQGLQACRRRPTTCSWVATVP